jgi:beta-glucanase (GH16 family)
MPAPPGYSPSQLVMDDQFPGVTLNSNYWNDFLAGAGGRWRGPNGYSATGTVTHDTWFSPSEVTVDHGLSLGLADSSTYAADGWLTVGGVVSTWDKVNITSGYVQVKAKFPDCDEGQWPAIWLLPNNALSGDDEIDMMEGGMLPEPYGYTAGTDPNDAFMPNWHEPDGVQPLVLSDTKPLAMPTNDAYHVYGMQLVAGQVMNFYIDGQLYASTTADIPSEPWCLILMNAYATANAAGYHTSGNPATDATGSLQVAEVQIYSG